jgi:hypothetical protein
MLCVCSESGWSKSEPIRGFCALTPSNQIFSHREFSQSDFSREARQLVRFFHTEKLVIHVISIADRYESKNPLQGEERIWWLINGRVVSFEIGEFYTAATSRWVHKFIEAFLLVRPIGNLVSFKKALPRLRYIRDIV